MFSFGNLTNAILGKKTCKNFQNSLKESSEVSKQTQILSSFQLAA